MMNDANVAILSTTGCGEVAKICQVFAANGQEISLLVEESETRSTFSATEKLFQESHARFHSYIGRRRRPQRLLRTLLRKTKFGKRRPATQPAPSSASPNNVHQVIRHSSENTTHLLTKYSISYVLLASSGWLIKPPLLDHPSIIINLHPGKLPSHRGLDSLPWSILNRDPIGITAHVVDEGIDTGDILQFLPVPPVRGDDLLSLRDRIDTVRPQLFLDVVTGLREGRIKRIPQSKSEGTLHAPMTFEELVKANQVLRANRRLLNTQDMYDV